MPTTLECKKGLVSRSCCGGGTSNQPGKFLSINDGVEVLIACPFSIRYTTTELVVYDINKNVKKITLADTSFTDIDNLVEFIGACNSSAYLNYERFLNVATDFVAVSFELPDPAVVSIAEIRKILKVYSGSLLVDYDPGFINNIGYQINKVASPNRIEFFEDRYSETVHIFY